MDPTVTLTRRELYDLVWSKPMTTIAHEFGVSSVAFAKNCTKLNVPRPGRGYWQQLASGLEPKREPLPPATPKTPQAVTLTRHMRVQATDQPASRPPTIKVPEQVRSLHPLVKKISDLLSSGRNGPMLTVPGYERSLVRVSATSKPRALRLLHVLLTAFDERGHQSRLEKGYDKFALEVDVGGTRVGLTLHERSQRVKLPEAVQGQGPQRDHVPSGRLALAVGGPYTSFRWSDKKDRLLDDVLGDVVLDVESTAAHQVLASQRHAVNEAIRREEQQRREHEARRIAHRRALADDLVAMSAAWNDAERVRAFLSAAGRAVPVAERSAEFTAWLAWALTHAAALDPLSRGAMVGKPLEPEPIGGANETGEQRSR